MNPDYLALSNIEAAQLQRSDFKVVIKSANEGFKCSFIYQGSKEICGASAAYAAYRESEIFRCLCQTHYTLIFSPPEDKPKLIEVPIEEPKVLRTEPLPYVDFYYDRDYSSYDYDDGY